MGSLGSADAKDARGIPQEGGRHHFFFLDFRFFYKPETSLSFAEETCLAHSHLQSSDLLILRCG